MAGMPQDPVVRRALLSQPIPPKEVRTVEVREITMAPGQRGGRHRHPCPVFGLVKSGTVLFQVEGEQERLIQAGESFYEPQDAPILHFDNASPTESLMFVAFYLVDREPRLIEML